MNEENKVSLLVNGKRYSGWLNVRIEAALMQLTRTFSVDVTQQLREGSVFVGISLGDEVVVNIGSDKVLTGYITNIRTSYSASEVKIQVQGTSKTIDLVECCLPSGVPKSYKNLVLSDVLSQVVGAYGIEVVDQVGIKDKVSLDIKPTEKIGSALITLLQKKSYLLTDDEEGRLVICKPGTKGICTDSLVYGVNILSGLKEQQSKDLYQQYVVIGQGANPDSTRPLADNQLKRVAINPNIRKRTLVINQEGNALSDEMQKKANNSLAYAKAMACRLQYEVQGWRQTDQSLWELNSFVTAIDTFLGLKNEFIISKITYMLNQNGMRTTLELSDSDAFLNTEARTTEEAIRVDGRLVAIGHIDGTGWTRS